MLSDSMKKRITGLKETVNDIMVFYSCSEDRAWQILATDQTWQTAMKVNEIRHTQDGDREKNVKFLNRVWRAVEAAVKEWFGAK